MPPLRGMAAAAALAALLAAPVAAPAGAGELGLVEAFAPGGFVAYRVRLAEPDLFHLVVHMEVRSEQPVLPFAVLVHGPQGQATELLVLGDVRREGVFGPALRVEARGAGAAWSMGPADGGFGVYLSLTAAGLAGDHEVAFLTAPAEGWVRTELFALHGTLLARDAGDVAWARGTDRSAAMAEARLLVGEVRDAATAWAHGGAEVPVDVGGKLFAVAHAPSLGDAAWVDPQGNAHHGFVVQDAPGAWRMAFGPDAWAEPCAGPLACGNRPHPAFALGADARI